MIVLKVEVILELLVGLGWIVDIVKLGLVASPVMSYGIVWSQKLLAAYINIYSGIK